MTAVLRRPRRHQARGAGHPDPQHRADEIIDQGIRLHGLSTWRTDRQDFESGTKQIKALAFKGCPVPFLTGTNRVMRALKGSPASSWSQQGASVYLTELLIYHKRPPRT